MPTVRTTSSTAEATGDVDAAGAAALDDSKRQVPHGPNPQRDQCEFRVFTVYACTVHMNVLQFLRVY
jgi:hypothetical protein